MLMFKNVQSTLNVSSVFVTLLLRLS